MKDKNTIEKFNEVSRKRHLDLNKLMKEHFSKKENIFNQTPPLLENLATEINFNQMSDIKKALFFLNNEPRLLDTEEFISKYKSFEEPKIE